MKIRIFTLLTLAAFILFAGSMQSNAATIDFTGFNYNMGTVVAGNNGAIATNDLSNPHGVFYDYAEGVLPSNTKITFTFNTDPSIYSRYQYSFAEGVSQNADDTYIYRSWAASDGWFMNEKAGKDGVFAPTAPTFGLQTTASLSSDKTIATVTVTNLSEVAANFKSYLFSPSSSISGLISTTYNVSAVPLPAALPLFGLALAGMAGYSRKKKKTA